MAKFIFYVVLKVVKGLLIDSQRHGGQGLNSCVLSGLQNQLRAGGFGLVEFEGVEPGADGEGSVEEVGEIEEEVLGGGLEIDPNKFGGKAFQGIGGHVVVRSAGKD